MKVRSVGGPYLQTDCDFAVAAKSGMRAATAAFENRAQGPLRAGGVGKLHQGGHAARFSAAWLLRAQSGHVWRFNQIPSLLTMR